MMFVEENTCLSPLLVVDGNDACVVGLLVCVSASFPSSTHDARPTKDPAPSLPTFYDDRTTSMMEASTLIPRYSRQMIVPSVGGLEGQRQLSSTSVLVVGAGGIGSSVLLYLAGAGIGHIEVLDFDVVEISNLHRQVLHDTKSQGQLKCESAIQRMKALNPTIQCTSSSVKLTVENAMACFEDFDVVVDATDNFEARYIINDACVLLGKPLVSGSAVGLEGQITVFAPRIGPCYRCVYPTISQLESCRSCANAGVLGPVPGLIGCMQAMETIKVILSKEDIIAKVKQARENHQQQTEVESSLQVMNNNDKRLPIETSSSTIGKSLVGKDLQTLIGRQVFYDATVGEFYNFILPPRNLHCAVCGDQPTICSMEQCDEFLKKGGTTHHTGSSSGSNGNSGVHGDMQHCSTDCSIKTNPITTIQTTKTITHITPVAYYQDICVSGTRHIVLDVRSDVQFAMVSFEWYQQPEAKAEEQKPTFPSHTTTTITSRQQMIEAMVQSTMIVHISLHQLKQLTLSVTTNITDNNNSSNNNVSTKSLHNVITSLITKQINQSDRNGTHQDDHNVDSEISLNQPLPPIYVLCRRGIDSITGFIALS